MDENLEADEPIIVGGEPDDTRGQAMTMEEIAEEIDRLIRAPDGPLRRVKP